MDGLLPIHTEAKTCGECYEQFVGSRYDKECKHCRLFAVIERIAFALEVQVGIE